MFENISMSALRVLLARSRGTPLAVSHSDSIMGSKTITGHVLGVRGRPVFGVLLLFGSQAGSQHTLERAGPRIPVIAKLILQWVLPTLDLRGGRAIPKTTRRLQWVLPTFVLRRGEPLQNHTLKLGSSPHPTPRYGSLCLAGGVQLRMHYRYCYH